jgi:hypothetical protein
MIGGVLTERTVGTVLPAVKENMEKVQVRVFKLHLGRRCAMPLSFAHFLARLLLSRIWVGDDVVRGRSA